jgi:hypothetical protein
MLARFHYWVVKKAKVPLPCCQPSPRLAEDLLGCKARAVNFVPSWDVFAFHVVSHLKNEVVGPCGINRSTSQRGSMLTRTCDLVTDDSACRLDRQQSMLMTNRFVPRGACLCFVTADLFG